MSSVAEYVSGVNLALQPSSELIDLSTLRGPIVRGTTEGSPCPEHGKRYWLFSKMGPCLHPRCVKSDLEFFGSTSALKPLFDKVIHLGVEDFISWAATEGFAYLADCWRRDPETWKPVCKQYVKHRRDDYLRGVKTETEFHDWLHSGGVGRRHSDNGTKQDYPDATVWLRQCATFLINRFGPAVTATVFGCVEITDLARLCFDGDPIKARLIHDQALEDLRQWHGNKTFKS